MKRLPIADSIGAEATEVLEKTAPVNIRIGTKFELDGVRYEIATIIPATSQFVAVLGANRRDGKPGPQLVYVNDHFLANAKELNEDWKPLRKH